MHTVSTDDLRKVIALRDLPEAHLQWLLDRTEYREYADGDVIGKYGEAAEFMWILLSGRVDFYMMVNGRLVYHFTFDNDEATGGVGGLLPYSRMKTFPGNSYASGGVKTLRLHKNYFHELEQLNPDLIQRLIGYMTDRARVFATTQLQHEKVNALGILAAGVAHELNNPAAAINRISHELSERLDRNYLLSDALVRHQMTPDQMRHIHALVERKSAALREPPPLTALQKMESEDSIADWLGDNGVGGREIAETFSEYRFAIEELEGMKRELGPGAFIDVLPWLENLLSSQKIIHDLDDASYRISSLVASIKSHVQMDRTEALQPTNIHQDIEDTLTLLGFKLREKRIRVQKNFDPALPPVPAFIGELNQVWTNLIDNAIFALSPEGLLTIETCRDSKCATVRVIDNGSGIPKDIISRIFDPFFTTKKVGEGTGIGLDIVNRIVRRHGGEIKVTSEPGRTEFTVRIPLDPPRASGPEPGGQEASP